MGEYLLATPMPRSGWLAWRPLELGLEPRHPGPGVGAQGSVLTMRIRLRTWLAAAGLWALTALALLGSAGQKWN